METINKVAEIKAVNNKILKQITKIFEDTEFIIVYDEEYEHYAYVCTNNKS